MPFSVNRKKIILTADDFGKSKEANRNILRLATAGKLDRVSVMIDGDINSYEANELLAAEIKLDIHFELIWQKRRRKLLRDNTLRQGIVFLVNFLWGDWPVPAHPRSGVKSVMKEWQAQIEKFRTIFGRVPDGISSHEHTHYFPAYFRITLLLAQKNKIPFVRFGKEGFLGTVGSVYIVLKIMHSLNKRKFKKSQLASSDFFASLDWLSDLEAFSENIPQGKTEIACHPEREDEYQKISNYF